VACNLLPLYFTDTRGAMKNYPKQKFLELAKDNDWSPAFAEGYVDGQALRKRGKSAPKFLLVAIDEYSLGFRAGFFQREASRGGGAEDATVRRAVEHKVE